MFRSLITNVKLLLGLFTSIRNYHQFLLLPVSRIVQTMILGLLLLSAIWLLRFNTKVLPRVMDYTDQAVTEFVSYYPTDLVIDWNGQVLTTQPSTPHQVYFPSFYPKSSSTFPERLAYYLPQDINLEQIKEITPVTSYFVITPTTMFTRNAAGKWSSAPLHDSPGFDQPFTLTKSDLIAAQTSWFQQADKFWRFTRLMTLFLGPVYVLVTTAWTGLVLYLVSYAFLVVLYRWPLKASQLARISIPAILVAATMNLVGQLLYESMSLPIFSLTYWIVLLWTLRTLPIVKVRSLTERNQQPK